MKLKRSNQTNAIRLRPNYAVHHYNLGEALWFQGRPDEAIALCQEAIRLQPDFAPAHNCLAWFLANSPDPKLREPPGWS
jgi:eukaryotic-like serine/threonine-protein kinase